VLPELLVRPVDGRWDVTPDARWSPGGFAAHIAAREHERQLHLRRVARDARRAARGGSAPPGLGPAPPPRAASDRPPGAPASGEAGYRGEDRRLESPGAWADDDDAETDRRVRPRVLERRIRDNPRLAYVPFPDRHLTRSSYERVFLRLVSGGRLSIDGVPHAPVGMRGWYHAAFRDDAGGERLLSIDELLDREADWEG
jgi:hypothetical protein